MPNYHPLNVSGFFPKNNDIYMFFKYLLQPVVVNFITYKVIFAKICVKCS